MHTCDSHFNSTDVIIPCLDSLSSVKYILDVINAESNYISQVIVVISSASASTQADVASLANPSCFCEITEQYHLNLRVLIIASPFRLYPGAARNIGILNSTAKYIAFLDANTEPPRQWLTSSLHMITQDDSKSVIIGSTRYLWDSYIKKLVIGASYGFVPLQTIPGSLFARSVFSTVGLFLPAYRSGEDAEFLSRLKLLQPRIKSSPHPTSYRLVEGRLSFYFKKWVRNYLYSSPYQALAQQSAYLLIAAAVLFLFAAMNWNAYVADWDESSLLYARNITKIYFSSLSIFYILLRGYFMPFRKGAFLPNKCTYLDTPLLLLVSLVLDVAKAVALILRFFLLLSTTLKSLLDKKLDDG